MSFSDLYTKLSNLQTEVGKRVDSAKMLVENQAISTSLATQVTRIDVLVGRVEGLEKKFTSLKEKVL